MAKQTQQVHCSFCGRPRNEVSILIAGQEGHICENCVEHAQEIVSQELSHLPGKNKAASSFKLSVRKPMEIKKFLDEYIIGQDEAKKILCVAVYNHFKRINQKQKDDDIEIERMMEQARVHVHTHNSPIRKRYLIPVKPLTKKNKKKSDNFFKRLFKTITKSVGLK